MAVEHMTAKVVVFIPPAVDPGDPPISMRTTMITMPDSVSRVKSAVLNPAVLAVADWNSAAQNRCPAGKLPNSKK